MTADALTIPGKTVAAVVDELAYRAKLNKPDSGIKTSDWDKMVETVAFAMKIDPHG